MNTPNDAGRLASPSSEGLGPLAQEWAHLKPYGYAPGDYMSRCHRCKQVVTGLDKRAVTCRPCAETLDAEQRPDDYSYEDPAAIFGDPRA